MYVTPQTDDGWVTKVEAGPGKLLSIDVEFPVSAEFLDQVKDRLPELVFASRSRLARLGIEVRPVTALERDGKALRMTATVQSVIRGYSVAQHLPDLVLQGLKVGRLVYCPEERRLSSEKVYEEVVAHALQLPASFSIDREGRFNIQTHRCVYDLAGPVTLDDLRTIVARIEGQDLLNRIQVQRPVTHIVLEPGDGVITSCSMFLHRHYVVLDLQSDTLGQHLQAVVLDPISTRGTRVFLEFCNLSDRPIVNPSAAGAVYSAMPSEEKPARWFIKERDRPPALAEGLGDYTLLSSVFDRLLGEKPGTTYYDRMVAISDDLPATLSGKPPRAIWHRPTDRPEKGVGTFTAPPADRRGVEFGTELLAKVKPGAGITLFMRYFPNLFEHLALCNAALEGKVKRLVFRHASYEHGQFLSARDHGRLADYQGLGVEVFWCNDVRKHVATHVYRGLRGYFMEPKKIEAFKTPLIVAIYGSTKPLPDEDEANLERLLVNLKSFFGGSIAILTGGGPGAMQQATDIAHSLHIPVGANFIETVDQRTNQTADFYQTFQGRSRHSRQRWFEVASFHIFCMGGVGTLEEVGLTLTDMKLGIIELSPVVFFGASGEEPYWWPLRRQLEVMVGNARAPTWLRSHVLMTTDPDEIPHFYRRTLGLG
jgi:predicted Rossmann-fold nucleotide-binding protein